MTEIDVQEMENIELSEIEKIVLRVAIAQAKPSVQVNGFTPFTAFGYGGIIAGVKEYKIDGREYTKEEIDDAILTLVGRRKLVCLKDQSKYPYYIPSELYVNNDSAEGFKLKESNV